MFDHLGWGEMAALLVLGLFVFGPERLPGMAAEAGKALRKLRIYAKGMTDDLKTELGPEIGDLDLKSLHPREFVRKHLLEDDDEVAATPRRPSYRPLLPSEPAPWDPDTT
ncbi:MAG: sec-independent translocase [Mycobacteriales bacterium]